MRKTAAFLFTRQTMTGEQLLSQLSIQPDGHPVILLIAGAKYAAEENRIAMENAATQIAEAALRLNAIVIDGGTNAGPMGILNDKLAALDFSGPYIGFLPAFSASTADEVDHALLGHAHSHFVLVEGDQYGDERIPMFSLIETLRTSGKVCGVVVNGGLLAKEEVFNSVKQDIPLIVVKGSGRLADELAEPNRAGEILTAQEAGGLREKGKFIEWMGCMMPGRLWRS
jgi:hypothetical protein